MIIPKYRRYAILLVVIALLVACFPLVELTTAYANETNSLTTFNTETSYIGRNTKILFGLILAGLLAFGAIKGWRRAIVLGSFLAFLGFATRGLYAYGRLIASWLNTADYKFIPVIAFFVGGIFYINVLYKLYDLMNRFLKKHL